MKDNQTLHGLSLQAVQESRAQYGVNLLTPPKETPWWKLYLDKFKDPIIAILLVATAISLVFGFLHNDFIESLGIIFAVLIATGVGFWQEYSAKRKFEALKSDKDYEMVKVRRAGLILEITKDQLVVGDVVILSSGDEIPADIRLIQATDMKVSESAMTGESVAVAKYPMEAEYKGSGFAPNLLLRGTTIEQGMGEGVVIAVGDATEIGKTTRQASEEVESKTPLEEKLTQLAHKINIAALGVGLAMMIILNLVHYGLRGETFAWDFDLLQQELRFLMGAVVVVIAAVPEGLPLSVTLALAFSMKTMAKENNLVKKMHACETVGAVNVIFTDKTGTLTQNRMTVVEKAVRENYHYNGLSSLEILETIGAVNASANWNAEGVAIGNPTECAILTDIGQERSELLRQEWHKEDTIPFSSAWKFMATSAVHTAKGKLIVLKGAPEVIARIIRYDEHLSLVGEQQLRGRRAISAAVVEAEDFAAVKPLLEAGESLSNCHYIGTWFIEDPVRSDVPVAIEKCYGAGIDVVMMTGDNFKTGSEIARQAGFQNIWAIEAKDFWTAIENPQNGRKYPNVIARCTPSNKLDILNWAQEKGYVCSMTGDGVNDAPSLNYADVGIAMGTGTSVAKEAADIVLLDDAFPSIVTGVKWGRSLYKNIKNFLFFQLSINVSACLVALFGPLLGVDMPFTVTQFLWINLVMDSLAAIALASEPADERVLSDSPRDRKEFIINRSLATAIFGFGGFIFLLSSFLLWGRNHGLEFLGETLIPKEDANGGLDVRFTTIFFAGYMVINWWNMFNARVIGKDKSVFAGLFNNAKFIASALLIVVVTIVIVTIGGKVFRTIPLSVTEWLLIFAVTSPVVIVRELWYQLFGKK